jgi:prepilin peptidase CpaA
MVADTVLVALVAAAAITDLWRRKIYNWLTYSGIVLAVGWNALGWLLQPHRELETAVDATAPNISNITGWIGIGDSLAGLAACGGVMVLCYGAFRIGGGDVKLIAMMGAFLGLERGIEALLWTFVIGSAVAVITLIWRVGAWRLMVRLLRQVASTLRLGFWNPLSPEERRELQAPLFLAPSALGAVLTVLVSRAWGWQ